MISHDIAALADRFAAYEGSGLTLPPVATALLVATLRDLAERTRAIEQRPVPPGLAGGALPPGVLRFPLRGRAA